MSSFALGKLHTSNADNKMIIVFSFFLCSQRSKPFFFSILSLRIIYVTKVIMAVVMTITSFISIDTTVTIRSTDVTKGQ